MSRPPRVLISKIGLDGHDRGAKLIVRNLRDAGMEVIYTGLWQTPLSTVHAAMQEDVDVLGVSLLSAAHMTIMPEVLRLCRELGMADLPVTVGGIIPEPDKPKLEAMGMAGVYTPGTPTAMIIDDIHRITRDLRAKRGAEPKPDITTPVGLARAATWIMDGRGSALGELAKTGKAVRIGVTGAPGVGKSTFIGKLSRRLRDSGQRVAVVAVDPSSPLTGGSLLGDRLRMMRADPDDQIFVRSLSSSGDAGGLGPHCGEICDLMRAAGYPIVLIETVGAGQNDVEIRTVSDEVLLLLMPGSGDTIQFSKAGVYEIATAFVVNKSDLEGADKTIRDLRDSFEDARPVWPVSSLRDEGLDEICAWIISKLA